MTSTEIGSHLHVDAFAVMMESSQLHNSLPQKYVIVRPNRMLDMKNDFIDFLQRNKLCWTAAYAQSCSESFVNSLATVLWYIDGNHQTFADHGHKVPAL